jgi:hypothetical protein
MNGQTILGSAMGITLAGALGFGMWLGIGHDIEQPVQPELASETQHATESQTMEIVMVEETLPQPTGSLEARHATQSRAANNGNVYEK